MAGFRPEISSLKRIVVKLGSSAVTRDRGGINRAALQMLCADIAWLHGQGIEVVLVSSGAIHAGRALLPPKAKSDEEEPIDYLQACSAVGQPVLMHAYSELFATAGMKVAQVLLTHDDFANRVRNINARNTLLQLLQQNVLPILNENDSVSYREITVGDNDQLAAMAAAMINADLLLMLTTPDGVYDKDPTEGDAKHFPNVPVADQLKQLKLSTKSGAGRGGMRTKLYAVRKMVPIGIPVVIATHKSLAAERCPGPNAIKRALTETVGTYFEAATRDVAKNERDFWLLTTAKFHFAIHVDEGAFKALGRSASLLPKGVISAKGDFKRGDCVAVVYKGEPVAVGLVEYDCDEVNKIAGKNASEIEGILGHYHADSVILGKNLARRK